jgi:hypothetical protein
LNKAADNCGDVYGCTAVAGSAIKTLGDTERAAQLYDKAESLCEKSDDYEILLTAAARQTGNPDILRKIIGAAENKLNGLRNLTFVAESILKFVKDEKWARQVYQKAEQANDAGDWMHELRQSLKSQLGDTDWAFRLHGK